MKLSLRYAIFLLAGMGFAQGVEVLAEDRPPPPRHARPKLTEEQHKCLDKLVGKPGAGERPSREKMDAAVKACGIEAPPPPPDGADKPPPPESGDKAPPFDADKNAD